MKKREKKIVKQMVVGFILIITILILVISYILISKKYCMYEYFKEGKKGISKNCYQEDGITKCMKENKIIEVDNYYIIE